MEGGESGNNNYCKLNIFVVLLQKQNKTKQTNKLATIKAFIVYTFD